jgi:hypothetical protein
MVLIKLTIIFDIIIGWWPGIPSRRQSVRPICVAMPLTQELALGI